MTVKGARCVVLGGAGFIGTNLCRALDRAGAHVVGIGRLPRESAQALSGIEWRAVEFQNTREIAKLLSNGDIVFHLLGGSLPIESNKDPVGDIVDSLIPSIALLEQCKNAGVAHFIFASSGGTVYGPSASLPVREDAPTHPITAYGINKLAVEKYLGLFQHLYGLRTTALRVSNPYGPFQHRRRPQGLVGTVLSRALIGEQIEIWGDGSIIRDYIHIDDVVAAMIAVAGYQGSSRVFNVGSGVARSVRNVIEDICALTSTPSTTVTYFAGRPADLPYNVLDCGLIERETGWKARVSWKHGLNSTADWIRRQGPQRDA